VTRTQISLTEDQHRFLTSLSRQTGESIAAIIRRAVERLRCEEDAPHHVAKRLIGAFEDECHDVSVNHDEYLWGRPGRDGRKRR